MSNLPIADHALISDCHSAALVTRNGSIDWLCWPRFDSRSVFARILDDDGGHWAISPVGPAESNRSYVDRTMVLETTFTSGSGTATLVDALAVGANERGHELGAGSPNALIRRVTGVSGEIEMEMSFAPRGEYGLLSPLLSRTPDGLSVRAGADLFTLISAVDLDPGEPQAHVRFTVKEGDVLWFCLHYASTSEGPPSAWTRDQTIERFHQTITAWQTWSDLHQSYDGPWRDLVHHSGRVLQALTFHPTGAIVAAPTTSLPEEIGGERNWDYRYAWVRDASLTLQALWVAACPDEAQDFFAYMVRAAAAQLEGGAELQIMFGIGGEHDLSERVLPHLSGWRDSAPVRIGNGAWNQRQLDVYGELLDAASRLAEPLGHFDDDTQRFLVNVAEAAASRWKESDQGIWEIRGDPQPFLYSKLMCWVAMDRAIELADRLGAAHRVENWSKIRDEISSAILERGWSDKAQAFGQAFGSDELDASSLMIPIVGFLPGNDSRVVATIAAIAERLTDDRGLVFRYKSHDGLGGEEGTFLLCTFWLAQAQALAGQVRAARETFERAAAFVTDVGLLAEEVDPSSGELLGNFPQAFSHIGLVNAAWAISQAELAEAARA
ncbi:MAG: alpha,alpha-trehalase [Actinomycetota bacterium]|nr:alpha,alpha-trehalase [Actinomycetota bacterium]